MNRKPIVLVPACHRMLGDYRYHVAADQYLHAVTLAGCLPLVVPPVDPADIDTLLDQADGVFLSGSPSNVHPSHFGESVLDESLPLDPARDGWVLPLIPRALARGVPLFAVCRGFEEVNVAFGGSLHQAVHAVPGQRDHRAPHDAPPEVTFGPAHPVEVLDGGRLAGLVGPGPLRVNSVHGQGVNRLADGLRVEALAPEGLVEAFSRPEAPAFNLCVQWHPEWESERHPQSMRLLAAFGEACRSRSARRQSFPS